MSPLVPVLSLQTLDSKLHPLLAVGGGDEGVLQGAVLHRALEVVVHAARLGEETLNTSRRGWCAQPLTDHASEVSSPSGRPVEGSAASL